MFLEKDPQFFEKSLIKNVENKLFKMHKKLKKEIDTTSRWIPKK